MAESKKQHRARFGCGKRREPHPKRASQINPVIVLVNLYEEETVQRTLQFMGRSEGNPGSVSARLIGADPF